MNIEYERANNSDLKDIIHLLLEDDLGAKREDLSPLSFLAYEKAFAKIDEDKNQFLLAAKVENEIVARQRELVEIWILM